MAFSRIKTSRLKCVDFSRKGEIDHHIVGLVDIINIHDHYFTTSSCSGRIILFSESFDENTVRKKGCQWLYVSHESASPAEIISTLQETNGEAVLKFEPFVLHVQCETTEHARKMHQAAVSSGFRNSGITIGSGGKIMTAVRSTHGLEVPLTKEGRLLVSEEYIEFIVSLANSKMMENFTRIEKFQNTLQAMFEDDKRSELPPKSRKPKIGKRLKECLSAKHKFTQTDPCIRQTFDFNPAYGCENTDDFTNSSDQSIDLMNTGSNLCDNVFTDFDGLVDIFNESDEKT